VREVLASMEIETRSKGLDVRLEITSDSLGNLRTDRYRLRQILVNLIGNAVKFTSMGSITVSLRTAEKGDQWIIDVADTGIGIAADRQALLFEPFVQADSSITQTYGGTGLGLALSRRLAERMGGSLVLQRSALGTGSTFRLTLNHILAAPSPEHEQSSSDTAPAEGGIVGLRILLVEDHRDIQLALRRLLEQEGATVESARDGREALARFRSDSIDVVLMDLRMPNLDGVQATRVLRSKGCTVPIIALTADPTSLIRAEAVAAGCDDCLSKPFGVSDLIAVIRSRLPRQFAST
jgi:CheY-like chemotaxis protein